MDEPILFVSIGGGPWQAAGAMCVSKPSTKLDVDMAEKQRSSDSPISVHDNNHQSMHRSMYLSFRLYNSSQHQRKETP